MSNRPTLQGGGLITLDWLRLAETRCSSGRDPKRHPVSLPTFCAHPPVNRQGRLMTAGQRVEIHRLQSQVNNDDNSFHEGWGAVRFGRGWWQGSRAARPGAASFPVLSYSWTAAQLSFLTPGPAVTSRGGESEKSPPPPTAGSGKCPKPLLSRCWQDNAYLQVWVLQGRPWVSGGQRPSKPIALPPFTEATIT